MAIDHIATPAVPPAMMIAPRLRSDGDWPAGVKSFFVTSYAAKYLDNSSEAGRPQDETPYSRRTARAISQNGCRRTTEDTAHSTFTVQVFHDIEHALVLGATLSLSLNLAGYECITRRMLAMDLLACKRTFARSTGAVTRVVGIADRKPAAASSGIDNSLLVRFGVKLRMRSFDVS